MSVKKLIAPFYERLALVLIGLCTLFYLIIIGKEILDPMMFGFLFAVLLLPVSNFLEKKCRLPRSASSFVSILLLVGFVGGVLYLIGSQVSSLANDWPMLQKQVTQSINNLSDWVQNTYHINTHKQLTYVNSTADKIMESGTAVLGTTFGAVSSLLLFYVFILIFTFFILFYRRLLFRFITWVFSEEHKTIVVDIVENVQKILRQYILGLLIEMVIVSGMAITVFYIIGIKYAALLGIIVGVFNIIPYIGIFTALLLSTIVTFATGTLSQAVTVAVSVIGIHAVDANFLLPAVVGSKVRLNALISFIGIIIGEMVWGLSGMFLSIPVMAIIKIIFDRIESLKPWGYLLGGDYEYKDSARKKMKTE
ncbi:AI-2E family transporter [Mucilaginibacter phyllosphaerae]|uniref:AI-2E family transporter n=1 Tax=Mucilaginibacter phyllosphaerae TaxID=1812349 RepID=A0A4Y8AGK9_9SPHI|nr:AI-2E family transporter [Mucilaginibacter phyllosphaerae]MBB3968479.1 putative PurR-regulated permease PerM [Mucilaginibacter phyllosphaerae]TEW67874.1 AI-2E family transporter [Mucilaginibacter phyllosphaerae]GGH15752.1 AI-2E family transporter [Mucilaginibacter phyllosphaerae]